MKYEAKKKDIERLQEKEKTLHQNFQLSLGDNNKYAEFLTKLFKKKIKKVRKKTKDNAGKVNNLMKTVALVVF